MPRNGSGTYSLPEPPFVPLTTISSAAMNSDLSDIGTALTGSLARDGQGGMTAVLPLNTTGFTYTNDTNTGMYRSGSDAQAIKCGGTDIIEVTTSGANVVGSISQNGFNVLPIGFGPFPCILTTAPSGWIFVGKLYSRTTYAALWAVAQAEIALGNTFFTNGDGSTTFGVGLNMPGRVLACNDSISGSAAGTLTQAVYGTNPAVIGNIGGAQTVTLVQGNVPSYNLTASGLAVSGSITPNVTTANGFTLAKSDAGNPSPGATNSVRAVDGTPSTTFSLTAGGTIPSGGSGTAVNKLQPTLITNYIIYAGV